MNAERIKAFLRIIAPPRRLTVFTGVCLAAMLAFGSFDLRAQRVYSELTDEAQIRVFTEVSEGLICQCGCRMVLSTCPHVECPWGIPARRFIENRIRAGMDADAILAGFENGFGPKIEKDPIVIMLREQGREDFVANLRDGFGAHVRARTGHTVPALIVIVFSLLMFWLGHRWWQANRRGNRDGAKQAKPGSEEKDESDLEADVRARLEDLDR